MSLNVSRRERRALASENRRRPSKLAPVPQHEWPTYRPEGLMDVWRSRDFLVQVFNHEGVMRLSVCRTAVTGDRWEDGITWDQLQRLKHEVGLGEMCAIEIFPPDSDVVNVANMRHLWIVDAPEFMWRAKPASPVPR